MSFLKGKATAGSKGNERDKTPRELFGLTLAEHGESLGAVCNAAAAPYVSGIASLLAAECDLSEGPVRAGALRSILSTVEDALPAGIFACKGIQAFFDFDSTLSKASAEALMSEFKNAFVRSDSIQTELIQQVHRVLAKEKDGARLGDTLPRVALFLFLDLVAATIHLDDADSLMQLKTEAAIDLAIRHSRFMTPTNPAVLVESCPSEIDCTDPKKLLEHMKRCLEVLCQLLESARTTIDAQVGTIQESCSGLSEHASIASMQKLFSEAIDQATQRHAFDNAFRIASHIVISEFRYCINLDGIIDIVQRMVHRANIFLATFEN